MPAETVLALDVGTQSSRALLYGMDGTVLSRGRRQHKPLISPEPGTAEVDVEDIWRSLCRAVEICMAGQEPPRAVGLATQRRVLVACDADGAPLGNAYSWLDTRKAKGYPDQGLLGGLVCKLSGIERLPGALVTYSQANLLYEHRPADYARTVRFLTLAGWLTRKITGADRDACGSIVGAWPYDAKHSRWFDQEFILRLTGIRRDQLPTLVPSGGTLGSILPAQAEAWGLTEGTPLIAVGGDKQAEVLGAGVTSRARGTAQISLGTGCSVSVVGPLAKTSLGFLWLTCNAAEPGAFCHEYLLPRGFWMWTWYLEQLGSPDRLQAEALGKSPEAWLSEALERIPEGCAGLVALPRWSSPAEAPFASGALIGFSELHTRLHIARALVEGIAFDLKRGLTRLEEQFGPIARVRVGGGGAQSPTVLRILCDVLDRPLEVPRDFELTARGVGAVTAVGSGLFPTLDGAVAAFTVEHDKLSPRAHGVRTYERIYRERFLPALEANRGLGWWKPRVR